MRDRLLARAEFARRVPQAHVRLAPFGLEARLVAVQADELLVEGLLDFQHHTPQVF